MILGISKHIASVLSSDAAIVAKIGHRCFPIASVTEVSFPLIAYSRVSVTPVYDKSEKQMADTSAQIAVAAETYSESVEIAEMIISAFDKKDAVYDDFRVIDATIESANEDYIDGCFVQELTFNFTIKEV